MSAGDTGSTRMPWRGITSTSPSLARRISASRTGVRLMPSSSASVALERPMARRIDVVEDAPADGRVGFVDARTARRAAARAARSRARVARGAARVRRPFAGSGGARIVNRSSGTAGARDRRAEGTRSRRPAGSPGRRCAGRGRRTRGSRCSAARDPRRGRGAGGPSVPAQIGVLAPLRRAPGRRPRARACVAPSGATRSTRLLTMLVIHDVPFGVEREAVGIRAVAEGRRRSRAPTARRPARRGSATGGARTSRSRTAMRRRARASPRWCSPGRRRRCARRARRRAR